MVAAAVLGVTVAPVAEAAVTPGEALAAWEVAAALVAAGMGSTWQARAITTSPGTMRP